MSIRQKQVGRVANDVINTFLQSGVFPNVQSVTSAVAAQFIGRQVGTPSTNYTKVAKETTTDPVALTAVTNSIANDINDLYSEQIDLVNRIVRDFDYKSTWRQKLTQRMLDVASDLSNALPTPPYVLRNVISSLEFIDQINTTAFINFNDFVVELPSVSNRTSKLDMTNATLSWSSASTQTTAIGDINNLKTDSANSSFIVTAKDTVQTSSFTLSIVLDGSTPISSAVLVGHTSAPCNVTLTIDGQTLPTQTLSLSRRTSWDFTASNAKNVSFTLIKTSPDAVSGNSYIFDYGIQSIGFYYEEYTSQAVFQTQPLDFSNNPIGSLTLNVQQATPGNSSIVWNYSLSGAANSFQPITPGITKSNLSTSTLYKKRIYPAQSPIDVPRVALVDNTALVNLGWTNTEMPLISSLRGGRVPLFNLCRIGNVANITTTAINRGLNSWKVRSYHYQTVTSNLQQDPSPTLADFADPRGDNPQLYFRYQPTEWDLNNQYPGLAANLLSALRYPAVEYAVNGQNDRVMHMFSARIITNPNLNSTQLQALANTQVTLPPIFANHRGAVYLNGVAVPLLTNYTPATTGTSSISVTIQLPIQQGTNYLQIVTNNYGALGGSAFDFGTGVFSVLCQPGGQLTWYADDGPMTEVSLYELQFQTSRNDFSRYAIADDSSDATKAKKLIVVRELPTTVYDVTYNIISTTTSPTHVILQATLQGDTSNPTITPKITNFSLTNSYD